LSIPTLFTIDINLSSQCKQQPQITKKSKYVGRIGLFRREGGKQVDFGSGRATPTDIYNPHPKYFSNFFSNPSKPLHIKSSKSFIYNHLNHFT